MSATNPAVPPDPTEIAGRYEIEKRLGAGAFGTVYKAKDRELGRLVAIKTIRLEGLAASAVSLEDLLKRFKQEARVAAKLRHPNIVMLYDIATWEGLTYISMEFVDGVGLDRVVKGAGKMSIERAAAIGAQVADALEAAHKAGIVHRDIKPANIMIEAGDHVKVTDFGIAKVTDSAEHLTVTGSLLGTPSYMSPEQARGGAIDGRSDLFSVGCILYEMVSGQRAFRGESITALLFKIITEEPPPLRELDPTVSDEMLRIIGKALSKAPETRYQSGRELADDLLAIARPGYVAPLRPREGQAPPPDAPPGDVPTLQSPLTAQSPPTIGSAATSAKPVAATSAVPPTILTPGSAAGAPPSIPGKTTVPPVPPPAAVAPARASARPLVSPPARRKGGGAGLIVGLGVVGLLLVALVLGGGYFLMSRSAVPAAGPAVTDASPLASTAPVVPAEPASTPAEAAPAPVSLAPSSPPSAALPVETRPARATEGGPGRPLPPPAAGATSAPAPVQPADPPAPASDFSHLNELPAEGGDGRAAGEDVARKFRGEGGSYANRRFAARPRVPRGVTLPERPAVATLLYVHSAQEAYHRRNGRYASLAELRDARLLVLDVPVDASGFRRARYAFSVNVAADGYRAEAQPLAPGGRAFYVDDNGFVLFRDE